MEILKHYVNGQTCISLMFDISEKEDRSTYDAVLAMASRDLTVPEVVVQHSGERHRKPLTKFLTELCRSM